MSEIITVRDLAMVTSDIQGAQKRGAIQLVSSLIEIGGLLVEAKTMVEPKDWEKYIKDNFGYSTSSADNWMKLYREYGDDQASFFQKLQDSQTFGQLSYTKLLALTDIPAEERLEFVEQNNVVDMSTRELEKAIRERDEAREALAESEDKLLTAEAHLEDAQWDLGRANSRASEAEAESKELRDKAEKAQKAQSAAEADLKKLQKKLSDAEAKAKKAEEDAKKAAENPEVPESVMEQMRAEIAAEEAKKAAEGLQKELAEAQKNVDAANRAREEAERKLAAQQKETTMANPDVAVFKAQLQQLQADFTRLKDTVEKICGTDAATGDQLKNVTRQLLDKLWQEVAKNG